MLNIEFQYYKNDIKKPSPLGFVSLERFLNGIKSPSEKNKKLLNEIQEARKAGNEKLKAELKKGLNGFTPAVHVDKGRSYDQVKSYTGLAMLDFDKIQNPKALKLWLFNAYKCIIAAWISPSGKGTKALIKIPVVKTKAEYKSYTFGICAEFHGIFEGFDIVINNAVLITFIGHDPKILIRQNPTTWTKKGIQEDSFESKPSIALPPSTDARTDKQKDWVINWYTETINLINADGHPQLRDNSITLGGYVAAGYISHFEAESLAESLIFNHGYFKKGPSGYFKTAKQAIAVGIKKPLFFD